MNLINMAVLLSKNLGFIAAGLIGINFLVGFHELGHFLFCKLFNIRTPTFSIGFGSFIVSKKIGDTTFGIARWPLGGYVEIAGLSEVGQGDQKEAKLTGSQSFADKPFWQKFLVLSGGILFNLIFAYFVFSLMFMLGIPKTPIVYPENATTTIETVAPDSPAQKAGLLASDTIIGMDDPELFEMGERTLNAKALIEGLNSLADQQITLQVLRDGTTIMIPIKVASKEFLGQKRGYIGVAFAMEALPPYSFTQSIKKGFETANMHIMNTFRAFKHIFVKRDTSAVGGPITIITATVAGAQKGIKIFLLLLALISINLAVLNVLPLPILDGGQIMFAAIEAIIRRPLPGQIKEYIHIASWVGIMLLVVYLSARDIYRIIEPIIQKFIS